VTRKRKPDIDPRLKELLESAGDEGTVEAVLMFGEPIAAGGRADDLEQLVASVAGEEPLECNSFPNLRAVAVRAKGRVVKRLLGHPELTVATLNRP